MSDLGDSHFLLAAALPANVALFGQLNQSDCHEKKIVQGTAWEMVKPLKMVLCSPRETLSLKFKKKTYRASCLLYRIE